MLLSRKYVITAKVRWMQVQANSGVFVLILVNTIKHQHRKVITLLALTVLFITATIAASKNERVNFVCNDGHYYNSLQTLYQGRYIVPNLVHFYRNRLQASNISLSELTCIKAALRIQGAVYVHSDDPVATQKAIAKWGFAHNNLSILPAPSTSELPPWISILWNYGGIFLNNDIYILRKLDELRLLDRVKTPDGSILSSSSDALRSGWYSQTPWDTVEGVLLEKDWGALYIMDALKNCSIKAVRLGDHRHENKLM